MEKDLEKLREDADFWVLMMFLCGVCTFAASFSQKFSFGVVNSGDRLTKEVGMRW